MVYALAIAMDRTRSDRRHRLRYPPHYLIHAMAASCAYSRSTQPAPVPGQVVTNIMNLYANYYDPASRYLLEHKRSPHLWLAYMQRHQYYLQHTPNFYDVGRNLVLFEDRRYPQSARRMRERYGFGFREWTTFCFALYSGLGAADRRFPVIDEGFLRNSASAIGRHERLDAMFGLLAATPEEVGTDYRELRARPGFLGHDPALPTLFQERPLLRTPEGPFIAVHRPLVFARGLEGPYDISMASGHWGEVFGKEFGTIFERYVGNVLAYLPGVPVFSERQMRRYTERKICDYLVVGEDFVLLIECKATKYSSTLVTETAVKQDNSTRKLAEATDQLCSTADLVRGGGLRDLIGDVAGKAFLATIVTFRPIYQVNDDAYWAEAIVPLAKVSGEADWQGRFTFRPQVMAVGELERLVLIAAKGEAMPLALFDELLAGHAPPPDWESFLDQRLGTGLRFPLWAEAFRQFFDEALATFADREPAADS